MIGQKEKASFIIHNPFSLEAGQCKTFLYVITVHVSSYVGNAEIL